MISPLGALRRLGGFAAVIVFWLVVIAAIGALTHHGASALALVIVAVMVWGFSRP